MNNTNVKTAKKLTKWAKEPSVTDLTIDLDATKSSHDAMVIRIKTWNELREVSGSHKMKKIKGRSTIQPKLIRRQAEWRYSALSEPFLGSEKLYDISPRTFEDKKSAEQNELLLNWQFNSKINKVRFIDEYVRTCVDEGTGIVRLGWIRETETVEVDNPVYTYYEISNEEEEAIFSQALELRETNPRGFSELPDEIQAAVDYFIETQIPTVAVVTSYEKVQEEKIIKNEPTVSMVNPANMYIDPSCEGDYRKAGFMIVSFETSKAELKKDKRFKNLDRVNWSGNTILSTPDHETSTPNDFNYNDNLRKKVVAYEYWGNYDINGDGKLVPIVATWVGDTMIRMEKNPFPDQKPPFVFANYLPVKRSVMGEPDAEILEDNQKIAGAVTRGMIDLLGRSANSQQGFAKGFLDVTNRRRYESGMDYEFNPGQGTPDMNLYQHKYPEIPNSALTVMQMQNQEAESLSGVKAFAGGVSGDAYGDVAAGIRGVLDASSKREMNILRRLAKGIQDIGTKIAAMNAMFLTEDEVIRVTNDEYVKVTRDDLVGQFDIIVDIATAEIDEKKATDLSFMLQTIGPNTDPQIVFMIMADIAKLKRLPELAHKLENFTPQPDPITEQLKELEVKKMEAEIAKLRSDIQLNEAKTRETLADAQQTIQETDNEASGIAHERDLEKQKEQARGNQDLEVTKSLLKSTKEGESQPSPDAALGFKALSELLDKPNPQATNINSAQFDPRLDPALNQANNF